MDRPRCLQRLRQDHGHPHRPTGVSRPAVLDSFHPGVSPSRQGRFSWCDPTPSVLLGMRGVRRVLMRRRDRRTD
ncbi:protein of unknown function [Microbacterium sp. Nx66]|nr:protein of unknown function [Microbacterium sp. Nx66]